MASYYRLRVTTPTGQLVASSKHFKLTRTVEALAELVGFEQPYQIIHRTLKNEGIWCAAWRHVPGVDRLDYPRLVATVEDLGPQGIEADELPALAAAADIPAGLVRQEKPCILWTEADWVKYRAGSQIWMFVESE